MNIYEKLLAIQSKLKAPKSQYNSFGGYCYRSCEDILEAVKPLCEEVKATVIITDDIKQIGDRFYLVATAQIIDCETGEGISNTAYAREDESKKGMDGAQLTGAASSYARKYALNGLFAIDDTKDSDAGKTQAPKKQAPKKEDPKKEEPALDPQLLAEAKRLKIELANVATYLKKPVENLTNEDLQRCIDQKTKALGGKK